MSACHFRCNFRQEVDVDKMCLVREGNLPSEIELGPVKDSNLPYLYYIIYIIYIYIYIHKYQLVFQPLEIETFIVYLFSMSLFSPDKNGKNALVLNLHLSLAIRWRVWVMRSCGPGVV